MKVNVFDTHVRTRDGRYLHFDVLIEGHDQARANQFATQYLADRGITDADVEQSRCQFCHTEPAHPQIAAAVANQGYYILELQG
ncbi:MAG: DUF2024 family protein [Pseudomonas sp.]